jgi:hypothetical protein
MASADTLLTLEADEEAVVLFLEEHGGSLRRDENAPEVYWLTLHPASQPGETFYACVAWSAYPDQPPSVRFADAIGGNTNVNAAWPNIPGYRLGSFDICKPFTVEGYAAHPEWADGPQHWTSSGNPFLFVAEMLQNDLNFNYGGRQA